MSRGKVPRDKCLGGICPWGKFSGVMLGGVMY